jgi:hypothetical protein
MKKIASILILVFAFSLTTQAQKNNKEKRPQLSIEQQTELAVKQMTLALDLSAKQQKQIMPLMKAQAARKKEAIDKKKQMKKRNSEPSADEIFTLKSKILDHKIAMKNGMKDILNKDQFEKFEKIAKRKMIKRKKMMFRKEMIKKRKMGKEKK